MRLRNHHKTIASTCLGILLGSGALVNAQSSDSADTNRLGKLEKENKDLHDRLDALEAMAKKEGLLPSGGKVDPPVSAMSDIQISGFVTTSFFHDSTDPP